MCQSVQIWVRLFGPSPYGRVEVHGQDESAVSRQEGVWRSHHTQWLLKDSLSKWTVQDSCSI